MIVGNARHNDPAAGAKPVPNTRKSTKNGCWARKLSVDTANVDGDLEIVASNARGSREIASNVVAISVNNRAFTSATGASVPINAFNASKNPVNRVPGSDKYRATGSKCANNPGKLEIVSFNADPRPANTSPNPTKSR